MADDPHARDPWVLLAAVAGETEHVRLGPSATHVYLREPTFIAQGLATLDELSGGRAEAVISFGDPFMLDAYHVDWRHGRPLARVREAIGVMRTFLHEGAVTHDGEFFRYAGLSSTARPVQERLPLLIGAVGGPRSFQLAGEVGDGIQCVGCSRENSEFVIEHIARGAEPAGRGEGGSAHDRDHVAALDADQPSRTRPGPRRGRPGRRSQGGRGAPPSLGADISSVRI